MHSRRPRGRSVLLWSVGVFLGVQLTASVLLDYRWPQVRFPMMYDCIARIDTLAAPPNVIFLGSSRTGAALQDGEITRAARELTGDAQVQCFNAGVPVGDPIVCERVLRRLLERGHRPQFAFIEVCPEGVNQRNGWLYLYTAWIMCWDDLPAYLKDMTVTGNLARFAGAHFVPLLVYRDQIRQQLGSAVVAWFRADASSGVHAPAEPGPGVPACDESLAKWQQLIAESARATESLGKNRTTTMGLDLVQRSVSHYRAGGNAAAALDRLLALCRAHGIEPILFTVPLSTSHRQCYTSEIDAAFRAHLSALAEKYACRHVDCRAALPDYCFIDHHHAAADGAQLFSRKFAVEILAPIWRDTHAPATSSAASH